VEAVRGEREPVSLWSRGEVYGRKENVKITKREKKKGKKTTLIIQGGCPRRERLSEKTKGGLDLQRIFEGKNPKETKSQGLSLLKLAEA